MEALVSRFHSSGQDQKGFAEANGIGKGKLHYWIKKLSSSSVGTPPDRPSDFIPLEVAGPSAPRSIIIRCAGGVEIEIPL